MTTDEKTDIILKITDLASKLGWVVALPHSDTIDHLILGTEEEVEQIAMIVEDDQESNGGALYDILERDQVN